MEERQTSQKHLVFPFRFDACVPRSPLFFNFKADTPQQDVNEEVPVKEDKDTLTRLIKELNTESKVSKVSYILSIGDNKRQMLKDWVKQRNKQKEEMKKKELKPFYTGIGRA